MLWSRLGSLAYRAPILDELRWRIFPRLLPQFEARELEDVLSRVPEAYHPVIRKNLSDRIAACPPMGELRHLFRATRWLGAGERDRLLEGLDVSSLALVPADPEPREVWLKALSRLLDEAPEVARKILSSIDRTAAGVLAMDPVLSDTTVGSSIASERLALKARLVEIWAATDPASCREQLEAHAQFHFNFMNRAGLDGEPLGHVPTEPRPLCAADKWLDAIAVAAPGLVTSYAVGMLRTAPSAEDRSVTATIKAFGYSLVRWFHRRKIETPDPVWEAANERIRAAAAADDLETAATIAALELPGDAAKLRALREFAVAELSSAMGRARTVRYTGALSRLVRILERDAPDLAKTLTIRDTPR